MNLTILIVLLASAGFALALALAVAWGLDLWLDALTGTAVGDSAAAGDEFDAAMQRWRAMREDAEG